MKTIFALLLVGALFLVIGCLEPGYVDVICDPEFPEACERSCSLDSDCVSSCCGCISIHEEYCWSETECEAVPCECKDGYCAEAKECETAADCEGKAVTSQCTGEWSCVNSTCEWQCQVECTTDADCADKECEEFMVEACFDGEIVKYCLKGSCACRCPGE